MSLRFGLTKSLVAVADENPRSQSDLFKTESRLGASFDDLIRGGQSYPAVILPMPQSIFFVYFSPKIQ
jgi:hypothetical protein